LLLLSSRAQSLLTLVKRVLVKQVLVKQVLVKRLTADSPRELEGLGLVSAGGMLPHWTVFLQDPVIPVLHDRTAQQ
jgi:hypothetical protein